MVCEVEKQEKRELSGKKRGLPTLPEEAVELKRERERERERERNGGRRVKIEVS